MMTEELKVTHTLPSDSEQIPVVWRYELLKYLRSKRLVASLAIVAVMVSLLYLLPFAFGDSYEDTSSEDFATTFMGFASILVIICATFFGADSIVSEFQNRTGYLILPNPIKRSTLFLGKFSASVTAGVIVIGLFYVLTVILSLISTGGIDADFGLSFAFCIEYLVAAMAVAYLIGTILKGSTGAIVLTFFLLFMILPIVDGVSMVADVEIDGSLTYAAGVITYILEDPYPVDNSTSMDMGQGQGLTFSVFYPDPGIAALVMFAYAIVALAFSMVLFKRKQLVG
ncbi:MAG: ABC transporter permease [Thermoplasmata archaeon]|nr:ABC transporter permease [Thermoplasmata archaeon]TFG69023.1 MAG: ABC transporter permease [Methanomassiliicoccus sp.]